MTKILPKTRKGLKRVAIFTRKGISTIIKAPVKVAKKTTAAIDGVVSDLKERK